MVENVSDPKRDLGASGQLVEVFGAILASFRSNLGGFIGVFLPPLSYPRRGGLSHLPTATAATQQSPYGGRSPEGGTPATPNLGRGGGLAEVTCTDDEGLLTSAKVGLCPQQRVHAGAGS